MITGIDYILIKLERIGKTIYKYKYYIAAFLTFIFTLYTAIDILCGITQAKTSINKNISTIDKNLILWYRYNPLYSTYKKNIRYYEYDGKSFIGLNNIFFYADEDHGKIHHSSYEIWPHTNLITWRFNTNIQICWHYAYDNNNKRKVFYIWNRSNKKIYYRTSIINYD